MKQWNENGYALFREIGNIDDASVSGAMDCPEKSGVKSGFGVWIALAACLALVTGILVFFRPAGSVPIGKDPFGETGLPGAETGLTDTGEPVPQNPLAVFGEGRVFVIGFAEEDREPLAAEELIGDPINDVQWRRDSEFGEKYGIGIRYKTVSCREGYSDALRTAALAMDPEIDVYGITTLDTVLLAAEGRLMPFGLSYGDLPGIDLTRPHWNQAMRRDLSLGGYSFAMAPSCELSVDSSTACVSFSEVRARALGLDLYAEVEAGNWDLERLAALTLEGNSILSVSETSKRAGGEEYLYLGAGGRFSTRNEDGFPTPCFDRPEYGALFEKLKSLTSSPRFLHDPTDDGWEQQMLFRITTLGPIREVATLGVLPLPLAEKDASAEYIGPVDPGTARFYGVTTRDGWEAAFSFTVFDLLSSETYRTLTENRVGEIWSFSDRTGRMIALILANQTLDPGLLGPYPYLSGTPFTMLEENDPESIGLVGFWKDVAEGVGSAGW